MMQLQHIKVVVQVAQQMTQHSRTTVFSHKIGCSELWQPHRPQSQISKRWCCRLASEVHAQHTTLWCTMPACAHFKMHQTVLPNSTREGKRKGGGKKRKSETEKNVRCLGFVFPLPSPFLQPRPFCSNKVHAHQTRLQQQSPVLYEQRTGGGGGTSLPGYDCPRCRNAPHRAALECSLPPASRNLAHPDRTESLTVLPLCCYDKLR